MRTAAPGTSGMVGAGVLLPVVLAALAGGNCIPRGSAQRAPVATLPAEEARGTVAEGEAAPDAVATGLNGKAVHISDFRGKVLVLYFYPVDFASGATAEAEEFREDLARYRKLGAVIVGVSTDEVRTHRDFVTKFKVPFALLSDPGGEMARAFRIPLQAGTASHTTFLIDRGGVVRKVWRNVRPWGHSAQVLEAVRDLGRK